ncbi:MAG: hypothetical protein ACLFPJ_03410 [Candidatus Woesearchaeota archaeon]
MKYFIVILLISFLALIACETNEVSEDSIIDDFIDDEEVIEEEEILPEIVEEDEKLDTGEMI